MDKKGGNLVLLTKVLTKTLDFKLPPGKGQFSNYT